MKRRIASPGIHTESSTPRQLLPVLLLGLELLPGFLSAQQPQLIPQPREVEVKAEKFRITPDVLIISGAPVAADDHSRPRTCRRNWRL